MYKQLLDQIVSHYNNDILPSDCLGKIFPLSNNDRMLILENHIGKIFLIESRPDNMRVLTWIDIVGRGNLHTFISTSKTKVISNGVHLDLLCNNCTVRNNLSDVGGIYLCKDCMVDIESGGKLETKHGFRFLSCNPLCSPFKFYYTIGKLSLTLFFFYDNPFNIYRYRISLSNLTNLPLSSCYSSIFYCKLCASNSAINQCNIGLFKCVQCYSIMNCRNQILRPILILKLLLFWEVDDINWDIKRYLALLLIQTIF